MSKFGNLINQAKGNNSTEQENQKAGKPESQKALKPASQKVNESASRKTHLVQPSPETFKNVNLSIKVPEPLRRHWVSEAKRQGTSITAEIIEALNNRFGNS